MTKSGDLELARTIELEAAIDDAAYVASMKQLHPNHGFSALEFPGGLSLFAGNSPFSNTHGFGTELQTQSSTLLSDIETFFAKHNSPSTISLPSVADRSFLKMLNDRNYQLTSFRNVYIHDNKRMEENPSGIQIKEATSKEDLDLWLQIVSDGFAGKRLTQPDDISLGQSIKTGNRFFIGYVGGHPAAASTLYTRNNFARLGGMGTVVEFRGKGLQQAMIRHRVNLALDMGCSLISSDTAPGNNSQRNLEKLGFHLVYVRGVFVKAQKLRK